jgi:hypothetical protein
MVASCVKTPAVRFSEGRDFAERCGPMNRIIRAVSRHPGSWHKEAISNPLNASDD